MEGLEDEADAGGAQRGARGFIEADDVLRLRADQDASRVGRLQPGDAVEQGALADAGLTDQGDDLAGGDGQAEPAEHRLR